MRIRFRVNEALEWKWNRTFNAFRVKQSVYKLKQPTRDRLYNVQVEISHLTLLNFCGS